MIHLGFIYWIAKIYAFKRNVECTLFACTHVINQTATQPEWTNPFYLFSSSEEKTSEKPHPLHLSHLSNKKQNYCTRTEGKSLVSHRPLLTLCITFFNYSHQVISVKVLGLRQAFIKAALIRFSVISTVKDICLETLGPHALQIIHFISSCCHSILLDMTEPNQDVMI